MKLSALMQQLLEQKAREVHAKLQKAVGTARSILVRNATPRGRVGQNQPRETLITRGERRLIPQVRLRPRAQATRALVSCSEALRHAYINPARKVDRLKTILARFLHSACLKLSRGCAQAYLQQ
mmetsp:Transcript_10986/g.29497  ORF Transcript_10986/g.29497 Transcript_10986/m.29497 type:complete len:124 (-) Transcript_10986:1928-2299(-)